MPILIDRKIRKRREKIGDDPAKDLGLDGFVMWLKIDIYIIRVFKGIFGSRLLLFGGSFFGTHFWSKSCFLSNQWCNDIHVDSSVLKLLRRSI